MRQTIWKFPIEVQDKDLIYLTMPKAAQILHLDLQDGVPMIWAIFEYQETPLMVQREFQIFGTGEIISSYGRPKIYVGTWQIPAGFVLHLFEWVNY